MRASILPGILLLLPLFFARCGHKNYHQEIYAGADSLLELTLELQARLGSREILRLDNFQQEITKDLSALPAGLEGNPSIGRYRELSDGLGQCMKACSQFHEEAFLLETSLREIQERAGQEETNRQELTEQLDFEKKIYVDLFLRIDSSFARAIRQAELFYTLQPEIQKIREESEQSASQVP